MLAIMFVLPFEKYEVQLDRRSSLFPSVAGKRIKELFQRLSYSIRCDFKLNSIRDETNEIISVSKVFHMSIFAFPEKNMVKMKFDNDFCTIINVPCGEFFTLH